VAEQLALRLHVRDVPDSDVDSKRLAVLSGAFHGFPQSVQANARMILEIRPQPPSYALQFIIVPSFDAA
jgi:hypothetical protein